MFIQFLKFLTDFNDKLFLPIDKIIEKLSLSEWISDALADSIHMLLFLFLTFLFIEILEYFYSEKVQNFSKYSSYAGPFVGALLATFPQCGFSVIATGLYIKDYITLGTLLAIYISTSDETIPILLANPQNIKLILPIVGAKIIIGICAGYFVDFIFRLKINKKEEVLEHTDNIGCCSHHITQKRKIDLILHPLRHTFNIFLFVLVITLIFNYIFNVHQDIANNLIITNPYLQIPVITLIGLIPNCAASVLITLMFAKGAITFASAIAGLCASAGLGLLVLIKNNKNLTDTLKVISFLVIISLISGFVIQIF